MAEKYKSEFIEEKDLKINVWARTIGNFKTRIVEIEHTPTGFIVKAENESQLQAYELAIKMLENKIISVFMNLIIK